MFYFFFFLPLPFPFFLPLAFFPLTPVTAGVVCTLSIYTKKQKLPSDFGLGVTGTSTSTDGCIIHDSLKNGKTCNVECADGYEMPSTTSVTTFTCNKGALVAPTLQCTVKAGHTFTVTKATPCTDCVETTSCTAILVVETWVYVVIIVGAIVLIVVVVVVYVKCCKKGTATKTDGTKGLAKSKEVEMADVEDGNMSTM